MHNIKTEQDENELQKELYIATIMHDLKNPLQAQLCSLKLLRDEYFGEIRENQKEILNVIIESCNFMREMLLSVLETYKIDNGLARLKLSEININEIIENCINEIRNFSADNKIEIKYVNTSKTPYLYADFNLIRRVIANLLNNAVNYSFKKTVLSIIFSEDKNNLYIKISNTGYKISHEVQEQMFDKFIFSKNSNNQKGIGLGLYFCKKVIEAHNGKISLICSKNNNEFIIQLPKNVQISGNLKFV